MILFLDFGDIVQITFVEIYWGLSSIVYVLIHIILLHFFVSFLLLVNNSLAFLKLAPCLLILLLSLKKSPFCFLEQWDCFLFLSLYLVELFFWSLSIRIDFFCRSLSIWFKLLIFLGEKLVKLESEG